MSFQTINFGKSSAEIESNEFPELLIEGYLDEYDYTRKAIEGNRFLFLGYKGSGKTALAEHIKLLPKHEESLFTRIFTLSEFPYKRFSDMINNSFELEAKFPVAWSWLLLLIIADLFNEDNDVDFEDHSHFEDINLISIQMNPSWYIKDYGKL